MPMSRPLFASLALLAVAARLDAAPGDPVGVEFQVNTFTTGTQSDCVVAADGPGGFVVVWDGAGGGTDQSGHAISARRYDAAGTPRGDEFQVNAYTTGEQSSATVIRDGSGFVVLWGSNGSSGSDQDEGSIQARRYDAAGPLGAQFQVNTYTTGYQFLPFAAQLDPEGFVVVWRGAGGGTDTSGTSINGQLFSSTWTPVGGEFQVNTYTTSYQEYPSVAPLGGGGFVVVWHSAGGAGSDTSGRSVQAQRFDALGMPAGGQFQLNTYTSGGQDFPGVLADGAGGFVAQWRSAGSFGTDSSGYSMQARRFDSQGVPQGAEFQVNTYTTGDQFGYIAGPDGTGGFVVVWESDGSAGTDTSSDSIQARRFNADWQPVADQFQVNTHTTEGQNFPGVAPDGAGGFVIVWRSGSAYGDIRAQRFEGASIATTTTTTTTPTASTTSTTVRPGESLDGRKLQLTGKPGRPDKSKLALAAKDDDLTLGRGNQSDDDPVVNGGRLTIASATGDFDATHDLSGSWKYVGKAGQNRGYKWKSRTAAVRSVLVKPGKLGLAAQGATLGVDLDDDPNPVRIELAIGAHTYCLEFGGGDRRFKVNRLFRATRATAPATCP